MIRKHKRFNRPKHPFDSERIKSENVIVKKYGLKNKREIWKAKARLDEIRNRAKKMIHEDEESQTIFLDKLRKAGLKVETTVDVLALTEEDILNRRLQTIVMSKGLATTPKGARQLITHKHISIDKRIVNIPSYFVSVEDEKKLDILLKLKKKKVVKPEKAKIVEGEPVEVAASDQVGPEEGVHQEGASSSSSPPEGKEKIGAPKQEAMEVAA